MRHFYLLLLTLAGASALAFSSCVKAPELTLTSPTSIDLNVDGSSSTITFTANRDWSVRSSDSWVSVSPSSGTASDEAVTVRVSCSANTTYEDRTATITITMEELTQTVSVKQPANMGIILPTQSYNLASDARSIEVEVQSNVQYTVSISDKWIKQTGTKGLTTNKLTFSVEENDTYDGRSATITIKPQNATVQEQVITVKQAQKDALIVKDTSFDMPYGGGEIEVKVEANVTFDVKPSEDWIHYVETKALSGSTVRLTVDENATYSAREGKIEIKQKNGTLSHTLTVKQAGRIAVTSIELNKTSLTLKEGESETLVATVKPDNATDKTVTWSSSATNIASVDETGNVTAVAKGEATIIARAGEKTEKCTVSVYKEIPVSSIELDKNTLSLVVGDKVSLKATVKPDDATDKTVNWYSSDVTVVLVDSKGVVTAWGEGTATVKAKQGAVASAPCVVTVKKKGVAVTEISLNKANLELAIGDSETLVATIKPEDATETVTWFSSDASVAAVDENGKVTAINTGTAAIIARVGEYTAACAVTVHETTIKVTSISLNKSSLTLSEGASETLVATIYPSNATEKVYWGTTSPAIATVDSDGKVTGIKSGSATISVIAGEKMASCEVTVVPGVQVPEAIDLGLSVKWASFNLGASKPEDNGDYYAWGETAPKEYYNFETYVFGLGSKGKYPQFSKYNTDIMNGDVDKKIVLDSEDDAAHVLLGGNWHIPTEAEWKELINKCTWTWTIENGVCGYVITSKVKGYEGKSIFLPAANERYKDGYMWKENINGYYWSNKISSVQVTHAFCLYFDNSENGMITTRARDYGHAIRPVK